MTNIQHAQSSANSPTDSVKRRNQHTATGTSLRAVLQDKGAPKVQRVATKQPDPIETTHRATALSIDLTRLKNISTGTFKAVKATTWMNPLVKNELERTAELNQVSLSKVIAIACEEWVHQQLHLQQADTIQAVIETTIRKEMRGSFNRMIGFQARIAMTLDVMKGLIKWLCRRIAGATKEQVDTVEKRSRTDARVNVQNLTPQLEHLTEEYEKAIFAEQEGMT